MKILIADDDSDLLGLIGFTLTQAGYLVVKAADGPSAIRSFDAEQPDIIVLDINMPGASGFDVCEAVRRKSRVPIMMLTVRGEEEDLVRALELGADDYLTKPFSPRTLLARVKALLRRAGVDAGTPLAAGRVKLDVDEHTVQVGAGEPIRLTKLELRLLQMLLANSGHTVSSDRLLMQVWGHRGAGDRQLLKQLVHRLRHKIEVDPAVPQLLQTAPGAGYQADRRLAVEERPADSVRKWPNGKGADSVGKWLTRQQAESDLPTGHLSPSDHLPLGHSRTESAGCSLSAQQSATVRFLLPNVTLIS